MNRCRTRYLAVLLLFFAFMAGTAFADGFMMTVIPRPRPDHPPIPRYMDVKFHRVNVTINNQVATTEIDQAFENPTSIDLEGDYIFPLPEDAAISSFQMEVDGKMVEGRVLDKETARNIYEDIVRQKKDPALLEYVGRNMFRARVYPVPAKSTKRIRLKYTETVKADNGVVKYEYPLDTERFSSRPLDEVTLTVNVTSKVPIKSFYSPSHKLSTKRIDENTIRGSFEETRVKPDKDFILYYTLSDKDFGLNMLTYKEKGEKEGYFLMFISPREKTGKDEILPKDVVFVLDHSGSMDEKGKMDNARRALNVCLANLNREDNFNVIQFSDEVEGFSSKLVPASKENVEKAREYVDDIKPLGGTNIRDALVKGLRSFDGSENPRYLIFITDGLPTVGITEVGEIVESVNKTNDRRIRIYTFGVGYDVNTRLLDKLASDNRGISEYIKPGEDIEVKISSFYRKIADPLLSDVELKVSNVDVSSVYPRTLPDIFRGSQLMVVGKYRGSGPSAIRLLGNRGKIAMNNTYEDTFPDVNEKNDFIPRLWAVRRIGYLLEEIKAHGDKDELINEVVKLSKMYGIITPYTSFLVEEPGTRRYDDVDDTRDSKKPAPVRSAPSAEAREKFEGATRAESGKDAVDYSASANQYKQSAMPDASPAPAGTTGEAAGPADKVRQAVKTLEGKTFFLKDGIWTDADYEGTETLVKVKFGSPEYFELAKNKKLARYLSVGERVLVKFEGKTYLIEK